MNHYKVKTIALLILSNLFLYLALEYRPQDFQKILLPLSLTFDPKEGRLRIKIFDSFGELITDEVYLIIDSNENSGGHFLAEVPSGKVPKLTILKTDYFSAIPFNEKVIIEEKF